MSIDLNFINGFGKPAKDFASTHITVLKLS